MEAEEVWSLYQTGIEFKSRIGLYDTVARNERFFAGDQWAGVNAPDLPKPVVNFIKRACQQRIADVKANPVKVFFEAMEYPELPVWTDVEKGPANDEFTGVLNEVFAADWERMKMDAVNLDGLQDACISGDYLLYNYWDSRSATGQAAKGNINVEAIDNVNYYPGNPNERDVQKQPYIILARRELIGNVRAEAAFYGVPAEMIGQIKADSNVNVQSGDMSHYELYGNNSSKCITLTYLYRNLQTGRIFAQKSTQDVVVRPLWDTHLTRYPIAMMNWELRKNCCHGIAEITGIVPVQRFINQVYAMGMLYIMQSACPKPVFNQGMVRVWSNAIGTAIPVNGDISAAVKYLEPPALSSDIYQLPERLMRTSLEMLGVSELELGNVTPTNTSAFALAKQAAAIPIETIQNRFYSMLEDFARNWMDMVTAYQTVPRWVMIGGSKSKHPAVFDGANLREKLWSVRIDVGAAELWSETQSVQTLNNLFRAGAIDAKQYIERLPEGYFPMRGKLLEELAQSGDNIDAKSTKRKQEV